ncbi:MAG: hypothetical protein ACK559_14695, partial [bacterium]
MTHPLHTTAANPSRIPFTIFVPITTPPDILRTLMRCRSVRSDRNAPLPATRRLSDLSVTFGSSGERCETVVLAVRELQQSGVDWVYEA